MASIERDAKQQILIAELRDRVDELRAEVDRYREALEWIGAYGTHDGDLLDGWEDAMRNIALNVLASSRTDQPTEETR